MDNPLVSAIITTHNRLELLKRAVESVRTQTYKNIELIVVDDKSDDGTREWCELQEFHYIHIPPQESRGGNYARNLGAKVSHGKYLAYLDDDDYWLPEKTFLQVTLLETTGNEVAHCWRKLEIVSSDGHINYENLSLPKRYRGDLSKRILYQITIFTSAMMVKKEAFDNVGGFDETCNFWQEYELTIRLAQRKHFDLVDYYGLIYRVDLLDNQRITNKYQGWTEAVAYIHNKHKILYRQLNPFQVLRSKILFWTDSASRAYKVGDLYTYYRHKVFNKVLGFPFRIIDKIQRILVGW